jgi:parallel beta-helix repeat protein
MDNVSLHDLPDERIVYQSDDRMTNGKVRWLLMFRDRIKLKLHFLTGYRSSLLFMLIIALLVILSVSSGINWGTDMASANTVFSTQVCSGDLNEDGVIDTTDIPLMVNAILTNNGSGLCADLNEDQAINSLDLQYLINLILNPQTGDVYYVSTNGSDSNDGTIDSPWATLNHAIREAGPGDTIMMREGAYETNEVWINRDRGLGGAEGQYLTIKSYPGETASVGGSRRIILEADFVRIEGLHFRLPYRISGRGEGNQILNNTFQGPQPSYGAIEYGGINSLIQGNLIEITEGGGSLHHGIYLHYGKGDIVRNNTISGTGGYGIHVYDENKYGGSMPRYEDILIEGNFVTDANSSCIILSAGESTSLGVEMDGIIVRRNVVTNCSDGITVRYYGQIRNIEIYNNTVYDNRSNGISVSARDVDYVTIKNNILSSNGSRQISISSSLTHLVVNHNLYHQPEAIGSGATDDAPVFGDPLFVNPSADDFQLQASSPAIDAGMDVGLPYIGVAPDLGAYEYGQ